MTDNYIEITIPGAPVGKGRARSFQRKGGGIGHYTPQKTKQWEAVARLLAIEQMRGKEILTGPVALTIFDYRVPSKSWPRWKKEAALKGYILPTSKPDSDNVRKIVKDALNGIVYDDDCQVCDSGDKKRYNKVSAVIIHIKKIDALPMQIKTRAELEAFCSIKALKKGIENDEWVEKAADKFSDVEGLNKND